MAESLGHGCVVDSHPGEPGDGVEEAKPLVVRLERRSVKELEHAHRAAARVEPRRAVGAEAFPREKGPSPEV